MDIKLPVTAELRREDVEGRWGVGTPYLVLVDADGKTLERFPIDRRDFLDAIALLINKAGMVGRLADMLDTVTGRLGDHIESEGMQQEYDEAMAALAAYDAAGGKG